MLRHGLLHGNLAGACHELAGDSVSWAGLAMMCTPCHACTACRRSWRMRAASWRAMASS